MSICAASRSARLPLSTAPGAEQVLDAVGAGVERRRPGCAARGPWRTASRRPARVDRARGPGRRPRGRRRAQVGQGGAAAPGQQVGVASGASSAPARVKCVDGALGVAEGRGQLAAGLVGERGGKAGPVELAAQLVAERHRLGQVAAGQPAVDEGGQQGGAARRRSRVSRPRRRSARSARSRSMPSLEVTGPNLGARVASAGRWAAWEEVRKQPPARGRFA